MMLTPVESQAPVPPPANDPCKKKYFPVKGHFLTNHRESYNFGI